MRYEILGPLRLIDGDHCISLSAQKMEVLLAALIVRSDQVVSIDQLIEEIWGEKPPRQPTAAVHVYISHLRKFLNTSDRTENPIVTRPPGYLLRIEPDQLDLQIFQESVRQGHECARARRHEQAVEFFQDALDLWRGPALHGVKGGPILSRFLTWLEEARLECVEMLVDSNLALGRHRESVGPLYSLTNEYPLRESFYRQLMLALYRSERQADALEVYRSARATLNERLGLDPCRGLQLLQRSILRADNQLDLRAAV
jgi:DNA-binding SARP family transcriptional activator